MPLAKERLRFALIGSHSYGWFRLETDHDTRRIGSEQELPLSMPYGIYQKSRSLKEFIGRGTRIPK